MCIFCICLHFSFTSAAGLMFILYTSTPDKLVIESQSQFVITQIPVVSAQPRGELPFYDDRVLSVTAERVLLYRRPCAAVWPSACRTLAGANANKTSTKQSNHR